MSFDWKNLPNPKYLKSQIVKEIDAIARERERPRGPARIKIEFDKERYLQGHPHYVGIKNA